MRTSPLGVTNLAKDFTIEKLARMVEEAQTEKADTQRFLDHAEQFYAVGVILLTIALIVAPILLLKEPFQPAFYRAMTANGCRGAVRTDHQQPRLPFCPRSAAWSGMACCSKVAYISNAQQR